MKGNLPRSGIHGIAIGVENVQPAIAIQVHELDAAGAVSGVRGGVDRLLAKAAEAERGKKVSGGG
jgi:hypothetical protein